MEIIYDTRIEGQVDLNEYQLETPFNEGVAIFSKKENTVNYYYLIDKNGKILKNLGCGSGVMGVSNGIGFTCGNNYYNFFDSEGNYLFHGKYNYVGRFESGLAPFVEKVYTGYNGYRYGYINKAKNKVIKAKYMDAKPFNDGLARVAYDDKLWGYIDNEGDEVIPFKYVIATNFSEGLAVVREENTNICEIIDKKGKVIATLPPSYNPVPGAVFKEGMIAIVKANLKGFATKEGKIVVQPKYTLTSNFSDGLSCVSEDGHSFGFIDKEGNEAINQKYVRMSEFVKGYALVFNAYRNLYYIIDKNGNIIKTLYKYSRLFMDNKVLLYGDAVVNFEKIEDLKLKYTATVIFSDNNIQEYEFDSEEQLEMFKSTLELSIKEFEEVKTNLYKIYEEGLSKETEKVIKKINTKYNLTKNNKKA